MIQSPFLHQIPQCKHNMRKLRKKIYKYTSTHQPTKKPKQSIHGILSLLQNRNLPDFLIDPLKKRRNFDISSIKNVIVPQGTTFNQIKSMTSKQESEIGKMFEQHRARLGTKNKILKRFTMSTLNCESSIENKKFNKNKTFYQENEECKGESEEIFQKEDSNIRNNFSEINVLQNSQKFLQFEGDVYSQDQWLNF